MALNAIDPGSRFRFPKVRQAVAHAVNVDDIVRRYVLFGRRIRTAQLAPGMLGYDADLKPRHYDPARAMALVAEAGLPAEVQVNCYNLTTPREPYFEEAGEAVVAYHAEAGTRWHIVQLEYGTWINGGRRDMRLRKAG